MAQQGTTTDTDLRTFRDFLLQYNAVTEQCFDACIRDFTNRDISEKEERCSKNCMDKFLKAGQRLSMRFQEHQVVLSAAVGECNRRILLNMEAQGAPTMATSPKM